MKTIRTIELSGSTRQERLPGFAEDFPYIASWAETGQYNGGMVPWHWHPAVELFYMYSGSLVYETPQAPGRSVPAAAAGQCQCAAQHPQPAGGPCGELDPPV